MFTRIALIVFFIMTAIAGFGIAPISGAAFAVVASLVALALIIEGTPFIKKA
jgi:hypothetical protein